MGSLKINHELVTTENAAVLRKICPFGAITYENGLGLQDV